MTTGHRIGIDLSAVQAVREAIAEHGDRYLQRVFTPQELVDCDRDPLRLAGRFAAKEAAIKVLRPLADTPLPWTDVEVVREPGGHVELSLTGLAADWARRQHLSGFAVSLSHEGDTACAVVLAEHRPDAGAEESGATCR